MKITTLAPGDQPEKNIRLNMVSKPGLYVITDHTASACIRDTVLVFLMVGMWCFIRLPGGGLSMNAGKCSEQHDMVTVRPVRKGEGVMLEGDGA